jgi:hypothetical protein
MGIVDSKIKTLLNANGTKRFRVKPGGKRVRFSVGIFAGLAGFGASAALAALASGDFQKAYERLRADGAYQFEFAETPPRPEPPGWLEAVFNFILSVFRLLAPVFTILFWAGLALLVAGAAFLIGREIYRFAKKERNAAPVDAPEEAYRPAPELARALLEEADRLAAEGRYGDAVHVLLFKSIEDIERHRPNRIKIAMTSREIAQIPILTAPARKDFARIADAVEVCRFAGQRIGQDIFAECRGAYLSFAAAEEWA